MATYELMEPVGDSVTPDLGPVGTLLRAQGIQLGGCEEIDLGREISHFGKRCRLRWNSALAFGALTL